MAVRSPEPSDGSRRARDLRAVATLARAADLHRDGVARNHAGHPAQGLRLLRRALALLDPAAAIDEAEQQAEIRRLTARIWVSIATSESELHGLTAGLGALALAEAEVERAPAPDVEVLLHLQRGYVQVRNGRLDDGLAALDRAVRLLAHATADAQHSILLNRGTAHLLSGNLPAARQDFEHAAEVAAGALGPADEAMARHNLGYVEFLAGNLATALSVMNAAADRAAADDMSDAVSLLDRSRVLIEAGLVREADEALVEAGQLFKADRLWRDVAEVELARAECALLSGDNGAARRLAGRARDRFRRRAHPRSMVLAELVLIQADLADGRPGARLIAPARRIAERLQVEKLYDQSRSGWLIAAEAALRAGDVDAAREYATAAGPVTASDRATVRAHRRVVSAELAVAGNDLRLARRTARRGLDELIAERARFGSLDLQTASAVHGRRLAELDVALALGTGRPWDLLAAIERGRMASGRMATVAAPSDPVVGELLAELRQLTEERRQLEAAAHVDSDEERIRGRIADIQRRLRARSWESDGTGALTDSVRPQEIAATLDAHGSTLVVLVRSRGILHAIVASRGKAKVTPLGSVTASDELSRRLRADLSMLAHARVPTGIRASVERTVGRSLATFDATCLQPLALPDSRLVIVPTGELGALPWSMMPSLKGVPVSVAPSVTVWHRSAQSIAAPKPHGRPFVGLRGPGLDRARAEVEAVSALWDETPADDLADHDDALRALRTAGVVHVAAHGRHEPDNPLFSSLRMKSGPLFAYEIDSGGPIAEHVVLSACELGQSSIRPGDEALGLTTVLMQLGARSVVAGVAPVQDAVAEALMTSYHASLRSGRDSAESLAIACEAVSEPVPFVNFGAAWSAGPAVHR